MNRVGIKPQLLRWACERSGFDRADLESRFPHLAAWELGTGQPTLKQLEAFAKATCTPVGYLFLSEPPVENIPNRRLFQFRKWSVGATRSPQNCSCRSTR